MSSKNLVTESLGKVGASIHVIVSFGRSFLNEVISLRLCAGIGGGVSGALLTFAVLAILTAGQPTPTPTPAPLPF